MMIMSTVRDIRDSRKVLKHLDALHGMSLDDLILSIIQTSFIT